jgi:hypothetical protein
VPNERKQIRGIYVEGFMLPNASFTIKAYADDNSSTPIMTKTITGIGAYVSKTVTQTTLGYNTWGKGTFGGGGVFTTYKFRFDKSFSGKKFFNLKFRIESSGVGILYKIQKLVPYVSLLDSRQDKPRINKV